MTTQNIGLFQALGSKMDFLNHRQRLISQNIANADTPGYKPKDLKELDFGSTLDKVLRSKTSTARMERTQDGHLGKAGSSGVASTREQRGTYEVSPAGNAVVIEEQLVNANKTQLDYNLITSVYKKNVGMLKMAINSGN